MQVPGVFKYFVALQAGRVEWWSGRGQCWLPLTEVLQAIILGWRWRWYLRRV